MQTQNVSLTTNNVIDEIPDLSACPPLYNLVIEMHEKTGASKRMILFCAFAILSHATQGLYKTKAPNRRLARISLYIMIVANSGMLKSTVFEKLISALVKHQEKNLKQYEEAIVRYGTELMLWNSELAVLNGNYKKAYKSGKNIAEHREAVTFHKENKPTMPRKPVMLHNDSNFDAMLKNQMDNHPSLLFGSSEGASMTEGSILKKWLGTLVELKSGSTTCSHNRASSGIVDVSKTYLTMLIMVQEGILRRYLDKYGEMANDIGFIPRILFCLVPDSIGTKPAISAETEWPHTDAFLQFLDKLYQRSDILLINPDLPCETIGYTPDGAEYFGKFGAYMDGEKMEGRSFSNMKPVASRACEDVSAIASLLCVLNNKGNDINLDCIKTAIKIYGNSVRDHMEIMDSHAARVKNARLLYQWLKYNLIDNGYRRYFELAELLKQPTPTFLRKSANYKPALNELIREEKVKIFTCKGTLCIDLFPRSTYNEYEAANELHKYEGLTGNIIYYFGGFQHHMLVNGVCHNQSQSMFLREENSFPLPAMNGLSHIYKQYETESQNEDETVDSFF